MIAQDKTKLENQFLIDEAHSLYKAEFISKEQLRAIENQLPTSKKQKNLLFRIGFILLGLLMYVSICAFIAVLGLSVIEHNWEFFIFIFAAVGFIGAELFAQRSNSEPGLDDSFLIGGQILIAVAVGVVTDGYEFPIALVASIVSLLTYLRYINTVSLLIFCAASTATVAYGMIQIGSFGNTILPFVLMLYAIGIYFTCKKFTQKVEFPFYHKGILLLKNFGLALFYFSGNYLVVRELYEDLLGTEIAPNSDIPFAFFFYAFTVIIPVLYIYYGLKLSDRMMLWIGFLTAVLSLYTFRFYHQSVAVEVDLTVGGLILFAIAYFSIKKLKDKTTGITFQHDRFVNSNDFMHTEALILTSQFGLKPEVQSPMEFGGGGFSGGGSGGSF